MAPPEALATAEAEEADVVVAWFSLVVSAAVVGALAVVVGVAV